MRRHCVEPASAALAGTGACSGARVISSAIRRPSRPAWCCHGMRGFSLIEMAMVMVLLGLLLGEGLSLLSGRLQSQRITQTQQTLQDSITALRGYAVFSGGRLPCPDSEIPLDGLEDIDTASDRCRAAGGEGWFPYATLGGTGRADAWGQRLRYRVLPDLARQVAGSFPAERMQICAAQDGMGQCRTIEADDVLAVVVSHGADGLGATDPSGRPPSSLPTEADQRANADEDNRFISHEQRASGGQGGAFDDHVGWLPNSSYQALMLGR